MAKDIPIVSAAILTDSERSGPSIHLDTPRWFAWLDAPTTTRFSYALFNRSRGYIDPTFRSEKGSDEQLSWVRKGAKSSALGYA